MPKAVGVGGVFIEAHDPEREGRSYGWFAWIYGPEGNRAKLWQPLPTGSGGSVRQPQAFQIDNCRAAKARPSRSRLAGPSDCETGGLRRFCTCGTNVPRCLTPIR